MLREIFPIESYDKNLSLQYIKYELGKPRYGPDECRQLRLTYGRPFRVWLRLNKEQPVEEEVYLGDMPIMIGGGEFIINGAERVVVSQLHRSPGVDFVLDDSAGADKKLHSCRIIPERGSWIEINVTKKDTLGVRIDQSGKFSAMTLLRAMDPAYSTDADILKAFYPTEDVKVTPANHFVNWQQDPQGNWLARYVFPEKTTELKFEVDFTAQMTVVNPFDFFVEPYADSFPFEYPKDLKTELAPYLETIKPDRLFAKYLDTIPHEAPNTVNFLV